MEEESIGQRVETSEFLWDGKVVSPSGLVRVDLPRCGNVSQLRRLHHQPVAKAPSGGKVRAYRPLSPLSFLICTDRICVTHFKRLGCRCDDNGITVCIIDFEVAKPKAQYQQDSDTARSR